MKRTLLILLMISTTATAQAHGQKELHIEAYNFCEKILKATESDLNVLEEDGFNPQGLQDICNEQNNYFI